MWLLGVVVRRYIDFLILLLYLFFFAAASGVPLQPYEGCTCFIQEEAHTNERFISCDGHQLYAFKGLGVDLEVEGMRYIDMHCGPAAQVLGPSSFKGQRSRTRWRSQCVRVKIWRSKWNTY